MNTNQNIVHVSEFNTFSLFSFFLKKYYGRKIYVNFRQYIKKRFNGNISIYMEENGYPYFAHVSDFERKYCPKGTHIFSKWYTFLYNNTDFNDDIKSMIRLMM